MNPIKVTPITMDDCAYLLVEGRSYRQLSIWAEGEGFNVGSTADVMVARLAAAAAVRKEPGNTRVKGEYDVLWGNHFDTSDVIVKAGGEFTVMPYGKSANGQVFNVSDLITGSSKQALWTVLASQFVELRGEYSREVENITTAEYASAPEHAYSESELPSRLMRIGVISGGPATSIWYLRICPVGTPHFSGIYAVTARKADARFIIRAPSAPFTTKDSGGYRSGGDLSMTAWLPSRRLEELVLTN
ncbi:hypothetical protein HYV82_05300 [Candidatus Woesearchaeota archaeon]|nr:hypothetical protein [Candidatus Woesearchaeota archaeon]